MGILELRNLRKPDWLLLRSGHNMGLLEPRHDANANADIDDDDGDGDEHDDDDGGVDDDHHVGSCDNVHDDDDGSIEDIPQLRCCIDGGFNATLKMRREKEKLN